MKNTELGFLQFIACADRRERTPKQRENEFMGSNARRWDDELCCWVRKIRTRDMGNNFMVAWDGERWSKRAHRHLRGDQ